MNVTIIVIAIVVLIVLWAIGTYNKLVKLRLKCEEAFSTMDVCLKKRFDMIPNLVATVKGYAKHEADTLEKVIAARNTAYETGNQGEIVKAEGQLSTTLKNLFALAESYPDLKANTSFIELQGSIEKQENEISNARKYYNGTVRIYNTKVQMFPSSIIASIAHFEKFEFFEVRDEERENVKVEF